MEDIIQFTEDDVKDEISYWRQGIYCFVLGANPPWEVLEGYVKRLWGKYAIDKISFLPNGVFLVRFQNNEDKEAILKAGYFMYDNKPLIVKPWEENIDIQKEDIKEVPAWIKLIRLPLKFWVVCLPKIAGLVGKYVKSDSATVEKTRLGYARVMVELKKGQKLPEKVPFLDETRKRVVVDVDYEWKPILCLKCKGYGHEAKLSPRRSTPSVPNAVKIAVIPLDITLASQIVKFNSQGSASGVRIIRRDESPTFLATLTQALKEGIGQTGLFGLLETKVKPENIVGIGNKLCEGWCLTTNTRFHKGGRVWVVWNPNTYDVQPLDYYSQFIHMTVYSIINSKMFYLTMIYAHNDIVSREELWRKMRAFAMQCDGPWAMAGDFNCVLTPEERLGGHSFIAEMEPFRDCLDQCGMIDIPATGSKFTWNNKQGPDSRVFSRLDRFLVNQEWQDCFPHLQAHFHPEGLFDHNPSTVSSSLRECEGKPPFRYYNMWGQAVQFKAIVQQGWSVNVARTRMFRVVKNLKALKIMLRKLNRECYADVENNTNITKGKLEKIQQQLQQTPTDPNLIMKEIEIAQAYRDLDNARSSYLAQKAKIKWMESGDSSTGFFHGIIKKRMLKNQVLKIEDQNGSVCTKGSSIQGAFLDYSKNLLGSSKPNENVNISIVEKGRCCTEEHSTILNGTLNATTVTLIPKVNNPGKVQQFRPIACCNVIYKTISKLLCNRFAEILPDIISQNQGAFVQGRYILENVMICQDIIKLYNRKSVSPRCLFKIDLQKAYDSVEWKFVDQMLQALKIPDKFRNLIMSCVTTPSFTLNLNGNHFGYFKGRRGLRKGDPISPLLFIICMEYLTRIIDYVVQKWPFNYHPLCGPLKLNHMLFADDLLLFYKGNVRSIMLLLRAFSTFFKASGLQMNASKFEVFFNGVTAQLKEDILAVSGFQEGIMPFRYLGIPMKAGRLNKADCNVLVEKVIQRIRGMGTRKLSYAGRITLINSGFSTLHTYWAAIFILPKAVIKSINILCRNYLWDGTADYLRTPLVGWSKICLPKEEGGLGVKQIQK
ncbi:uncharacterized protein LOC141641225 [Silene latifolia]|uniref:uncharacterized protein LOC141641225 n=1 Tax=Silene latifolia TaxID=37657 RepID=UPI003D786555